MLCGAQAGDDGVESDRLEVRRPFVLKGPIGYLLTLMRTRVKICGITRPQDGEAAVRHGADAIGLVFYPPSPRAVTIEQAQRIVRGLPPFVTVTALFVNAEEAAIREVLSAVSIDLLQFHGDESPEACARYGRRWIKAVRMRGGVDPVVESARYHEAVAVLFDAYRSGQPGGTGEVFDWTRIPPELANRVILAGGLAPENVAEAIQRVRPYAVDVSGGVEREKGVKDAAKIEAFMRGVERGDHH